MGTQMQFSAHIWTLGFQLVNAGGAQDPPALARSNTMMGSVPQPPHCIWQEVQLLGSGDQIPSRHYMSAHQKPRSKMTAIATTSLQGIVVQVITTNSCSLEFLRASPRIKY